jgi:hypothetical protein
VRFGGTHEEYENTPYQTVKWLSAIGAIEDRLTAEKNKG